MLQGRSSDAAMSTLAHARWHAVVAGSIGKRQHPQTHRMGQSWAICLLMEGFHPPDGKKYCRQASFWQEFN